MGLTTSVQICNLALAKVGVEGSGISSLSDSNENARKCNLFYEPCRDLIMSQHPWKFALKRVVYDIEDYETDISAITAASPAVLTSSSHNITEGRGLYVYNTGDDDWDDTVYYAYNVSGNDIQMYKADMATAFDGSSYTAASSGKVYPAPLSEYNYEFSLPSDYLAFHQYLSNGDAHWEIQDGWLQTDDAEPSLSYISLVTDVSKYSKWFIQALSQWIAVQLAGAIAGKLELRNVLLEEYYKITIPEARKHNAFEARPTYEGLRYDPDAKGSWQKAGR